MPACRRPHAALGTRSPPDLLNAAAACWPVHLHPDLRWPGSFCRSLEPCTSEKSSLSKGFLASSCALCHTCPCKGLSRHHHHHHHHALVIPTFAQQASVVFMHDQRSPCMQHKPQQLHQALSSRFSAAHLHKDTLCSFFCSQASLWLIQQLNLMNYSILSLSPMSLRNAVVQTLGCACIMSTPATFLAGW